MKMTKLLFFVVNVLLWTTLSARSEVTQEQAIHNAQVLLKSIGFQEQESELRPQADNLTKTAEGYTAWSFDWAGGNMRVDVESGKILEFLDVRLFMANMQRYAEGEAPVIQTSEEAILRAKAFADRLSLPLAEVKVDEACIMTWKGVKGNAHVAYVDSPAQIFEQGQWSVSFRRFYNGYRTPDYFSMLIDLYEGRLMDFRMSWGTPMCATVVNVTGEEATRLALEGLTIRGLSVIAIKQGGRFTYPLLQILRPNHGWTDYSTSPLAIPFTRLAWVVRMAGSDGRRIGDVWIDGAP